MQSISPFANYRTCWRAKKTCFYLKSRIKFKNYLKYKNNNFYQNIANNFKPISFNCIFAGHFALNIARKTVCLFPSRKVLLKMKRFAFCVSLQLTYKTCIT